MNRAKFFVLPLAVIAAATLIAWPVYAHCGKCAASGKEIVTKLDESKLTLARAIEAAEKHSKGRAVSVVPALDDHGKLTLETYCIVGDKIMRCDVDAATRAVGEMKEVHDFALSAPAHKHDEGGHGHSMKALENAPVQVACGNCIYHMSGVQGCPLAVMLDGKPYLVEGAELQTHDYCDRELAAVITGRLEGDKFMAKNVKQTN